MNSTDPDQLRQPVPITATEQDREVDCQPTSRAELRTDIIRGLALPFYRAEAVRFHLQNDSVFVAPRDHLPTTVRVAAVALIPLVAAILTIALIKQPGYVPAIIVSSIEAGHPPQEYLVLPASYTNDIHSGQLLIGRFSNETLSITISRSPFISRTEDTLFKFNLTRALLSGFGSSVAVAPLKEPKLSTKDMPMGISVQLHPYRIISLVRRED